MKRRACHCRMSSWSILSMKMLMFVRWTTRTRLGQPRGSIQQQEVLWQSLTPSRSPGCVTLTDNKNYDKKTDRKLKNLQNKGRKRNKPQVQQPQNSTPDKTKLNVVTVRVQHSSRLLHNNFASVESCMRSLITFGADWGIWWGLACLACLCLHPARNLV